MITDERQYRITQHKASQFSEAIKEWEQNAQERVAVHPLLLKAECESMMSQLADMREELANYEQLREPDVSAISISTLDELALGLIKARIAGKLSQRGLAERLGLKEEQIQRYESEHYASASYKRLCEVTHALGIRIENEILLPLVPVSFEGLMAKVSQVGLSREFVVKRLLSTTEAAVANGEVTDEHHDDWLTARTATVLGRVFRWTRENILGAQALSAVYLAPTTTRFKMPKGRSELSVRIFASYAHYVAKVALQGIAEWPIEPIPTDPIEMRKQILARGEEADDFRNVLQTVWDLGIMVLPLRGKGTFHSACWRYENRNAIVLKQTSRLEARWTFDLLHEVYHAAQQPSKQTFDQDMLDATSSERMSTDEEMAANDYAGNIMLEGRAVELAQRCVELANRDVKLLKKVVPNVAKEGKVGVGALANYLAFQLSLQGINWWGASTNLQGNDEDPWRIAGDVFLERHPFMVEDPIDRAILDRALE